MKKIVSEQCTAGCRIRHDPIPAALRVFGTNAKHAGGRVNIIRADPAKLLAPQCRIVSERQHHAIANRFLAHGGENRLPVCLIGNPRQSPIAGDEHSPAIMHNRVRAAKTVVDKVAVEKPEYGYALLNRCIGDCASAGLHGCEIRADVGARHDRNG